jgi:hypothetical protein
VRSSGAVYNFTMWLSIGWRGTLSNVFCAQDFDGTKIDEHETAFRRLPPR